MKLLNDIESIAWLQTTHLKKFKHTFNSFIIYGNEDCPIRVDIFKRTNPTIHSKPFKTYASDGNGDLKEL